MRLPRYQKREGVKVRLFPAQRGHKKRQFEEKAPLIPA